MKKISLLMLFSTAMFLSANAQDEGVIVKKERLSRSNGIFVTGGPSWTFGDNIGDYKNGFNFELGYVKRVNRALSFGGSIGYMKFKYDPSVTEENAGYTGGYGDPNDWITKYGLASDFAYDYGYYLTLEGGDINMTTIAANIKVNFIPVMDESKFSVYGFAKPFVALSTRKAVNGTGERYVWGYYEDSGYLYIGDEAWYPDGFIDEWGPDGFPVLKEESEVTGGIYLGPGFEYNPGKAFSIFLQGSIGYTFPITYVSTGAYGTDIGDYANEKFPMVKEGFTSVTVQFGFSYNF
jgi:hypothetical protein